MFADASSPWVAVVLVAFSLAVIAFLVWLLASGRAGETLSQIGMALILGGACGNLLDRIVRHSVTDFIDFYISSHHWYTFNIADSAIVVGAGLVLLELFRDLQHPTGKKV
jgi:signal peptidase II